MEYVFEERLDATVREYRFTSYERFLRKREKEFGGMRARSLQEPERHVGVTADWNARSAGAGVSAGLPNPIVMNLKFHFKVIVVRVQATARQAGSLSSSSMRAVLRGYSARSSLARSFTTSIPPGISSISCMRHTLRW